MGDLASGRQTPVIDPQPEKEDFRDDNPCLHASILKDPPSVSAHVVGFP
jgi:hypothetical protein